LITRLDSGYQLSLSQRGNILGVHGVNDSTGVGIYDLSDPLAMPMIAAFPEASHHAVSPDGKLVAVLDRMSKTLQVIDLDTGKIRHALEANSNSAYSMAWSANSKRLACGTTGAAVQVWDVPSGNSLPQKSGTYIPSRAVQTQPVRNCTRLGAAITAPSVARFTAMDGLSQAGYGALGEAAVYRSYKIYRRNYDLNWAGGYLR
jgi:hypothetical protein